MSNVLKKRRNKTKRILCIEVGGTSFKAAIVIFDKEKHSQYQIHNLITGKTETPKEVCAVIVKKYSNLKFDSVSVASFGPLNLNKGKDYGKILSAPNERKVPWTNISFANLLKEQLGKEVLVETDVNASALGEKHFGEHGDCSSLCYITIGTGVGIGLIVNGKTVHGYQHPEGGHSLVSLKDEDKELETSCLYHKNCVEVL